MTREVNSISTEGDELTRGGGIRRQLCSPPVGTIDVASRGPIGCWLAHLIANRRFR